MMKRRITLGLLLLMGTTMLAGCKLGRFVWFNFAGIDDHKIFPTRELPASKNPFTFYATTREVGPSHIDYRDDQVAFDDFLEQTESVAFLVIRNDTILYERYTENYSPETIVP